MPPDYQLSRKLCALGCDAGGTVRSDTIGMSDLIPVRHYMTPMPETIDEHASLDEAKQRMYVLGVHHLPVVHEGKLTGILSQRDALLAESLGVAASGQLPVSRVMTAVVFTCGPNAHVEAVAREMAIHHYGSAIVVEPDHPSQIVGVFTTTDALRALADIIEKQSANS
jgi:acetoin utilization protein AcuB